MVIGAEDEQRSLHSCVLALDLGTGGMFWSVKGSAAKSNDGTPFNGQFPQRW